MALPVALPHRRLVGADGRRRRGRPAAWGPGQGVGDGIDVVDLPFLRQWLGRKASEAFQLGFVAGLGRDPRWTIDAVIGRADDADALQPAPAGVFIRS